MHAQTYAKNWQLGENALALAYNETGDIAALSLLDGTALLLNLTTGEEKRVTVHPNGAPLSFCRDCDGEAFLSAGDDGRVVRFAWYEEPSVLAEHKGKWIDHIATSAQGAYRAYSVGKDVYILGRDKPLTHPSTIGGMAFAPNGKRLAVSHYNGVALWWTKSQDSTAQTLLWKGSHLAVQWHPAGDYLMTSMQENSLHGWRMKDLSELRMAGYPGKIHSFGFSHKGKWLVTSGADQVICWPFTGSGPQGKPPLALGIPEGLPCTAVAPNPLDDMTAAGFASGRVILALYEDRLPVQLLAPDYAPVSALGWAPTGEHLISAHEDGNVFLFTSASIIEATKAAVNNPF